MRDDEHYIKIEEWLLKYFLNYYGFLEALMKVIKYNLKINY